MGRIEMSLTRGLTAKGGERCILSTRRKKSNLRKKKGKSLKRRGGG